jgi:hypothetical protein
VGAAHFAGITRRPVSVATLWATDGFRRLFFAFHVLGRHGVARCHAWTCNTNDRKRESRFVLEGLGINRRKKISEKFLPFEELCLIRIKRFT